MMWWCGLNSAALGQDTLVGVCKHEDESFEFPKSLEILNQMSDYRMFKETLHYRINLKFSVLYY
jgi:hypothetical protein